MKLILAFFFIASAAADISVKLLSDDYINDINKQNLTWKAERFFDKSMTLEQARKLLGALSSDKILRSLPVRYHDSDDKEIPDTFDTREKWSKCNSIRMVRDQANCGSCWAFAAVEAMSDRICIHSNEKNQTLVSAEDLLSCCGTKCGDGCNGGYPAAAWEYWYTNGLVSGGLNGDTNGCKAYSLASCNHHVEGGENCPDNAATPACIKKCDDSTLDYESQRIFGSKPYALSSLVKDIQIEIMTNGPVEASFDVFQSFLVYKEGVYRKLENDKSVGGHAVKIIGWGSEDNTAYWLIANSWNEKWGENGFFKMLRGVYKKTNNSKVVGKHAVKILGWGVENNVSYWLIANSWNEDWGENGFFTMFRGHDHCGIESTIVAGIPDFRTNDTINPNNETSHAAASTISIFSIVFGILLWFIHKNTASS